MPYQNLILLHLREQGRLTYLQIERRTGIPAADYRRYEQEAFPVPEAHLQLLATLFKIKPAYLRTYCDQLEFFSHTKGIMELKNKRLEELTRALKRYIRKAPLPKPK